MVVSEEQGAVSVLQWFGKMLHRVGFSLGFEEELNLERKIRRWWVSQDNTRADDNNCLNTLLSLRSLTQKSSYLDNRMEMESGPDRDPITRISRWGLILENQEDLETVSLLVDCINEAELLMGVPLP